MPLKVLCAGCPKDERDPAEAAVRAALGQAAGSWTVSLVKIGPQWSVTVDGPDVKHKTAMVPSGNIKQAIQEMLPGPAPPPAPVPKPAPAPAPAPMAAAGLRPPSPPPGAATPRAPLPPTRSAPVPTPRPAPAPAPVLKPASSPVRTATPTPVTRTPAPSRPAASSARPSHSGRAGEHQDRYDCQYCGGAFVVIYEAGHDSAQETVAVACPHCWKNSHVMVAEEAALSRDYRAEKA